LPEQNNENIDDEVAADLVWKQSRLAEDSIIVDLFRVSHRSAVVLLVHRYHPSVLWHCSLAVVKASVM